MNHRIKLIVLIISGLLLLELPIISAQTVDVQVDGQKIFKTVSYFSSDQFLGRKPNTAEFSKLQDWVVDQFKTWGMEPAGDNGSFIQAVPINREYAVTYGTPRMVINGREFFSRYEDFSIDLRSTADLKISENVIFTGYGISAPEKGLDEYADVDVKGKIVFAFKGNPNDFTVPRSRLLPSYMEEEPDQSEVTEDWAIESNDSTKIMVAYQKGAAGIILYHPEGETDFFRRFRPVVEESPFERDFIVVSEVSEQLFHWLFWTDPQMSSRSFRTWLNKIRGDIKGKKAHSFDTGIEAEIYGFEKILLKGEEYDDNEGRNIITKITGSDPDLKNQYVIIGAHFDHVGVTNGQIYNGAEDNASGSGVIFELARLMKENNIRAKRTIIFCLWTAEEMGLIGSRYWVKNPTDGVTMDQVVTYFNLDMVGLGDVIDAPGALNFPSIWNVIKRDQDEDVINTVKPSVGGPGGSDQTAFIELGIEAMALMTHGKKEGHPDYHDTGDDGYKLNPETFRKVGQFVLQGAVNVGNETSINLIIPDRQNIYCGVYWPITVINPELGSKDGWKWLEAETHKDLTDMITDKIRELKNPPQSTDPYAAMRRRWGTVPRNTGLKGAGLVNYDVSMLEIAKEVLDFGRIDIYGDDSVWFDKGLTKQGTSALAAMRKNKIALHVINPSKETLTAVLEKTRKPFLLSGYKDFDEDIIAKIKKRKVLIAVDFNPEDVQGCVTELEMLKAKLDTTSNLFIYVTSEDGLDQAKQDLYRQLIKKGWNKDQIYAIGGKGVSRRSEGNLDILPGGRPPFRGRR